tara:strand:- start:1802 stop:1957 length:156 start_codon:yes stop_codon:yes gene_type:complete
MRYVYTLIIDNDDDPEPAIWEALNERFLAGADHIYLELKDYYKFSDIDDRN